VEPVSCSGFAGAVIRHFGGWTAPARDSSVARQRHTWDSGSARFLAIRDLPEKKGGGISTAIHNTAFLKSQERISVHTGRLNSANHPCSKYYRGDWRW